MRYAFAGDRQISYNILSFLIKFNYYPLAIFVSDGDNSSHSDELISLSGLSEEYIFLGNEIKSTRCEELLKKFNLDYIFGIHFPYIIPNTLLEIPKVGFLNLHPAYLPFNKGWHTPSWAIMDGTPFGATLHFMSEALDEGDIILQKEIEVKKSDTANSLYKKVLDLEEQVFYEAFESIKSLNPTRLKQVQSGTSHNKRDLKEIQKLNVDDNTNIMIFIDKLRALTTNNIEESAFFEFNNKKIHIQVNLIEIDKDE
jgi:methionyl-tRNA formyltransferase